MEFLLTYINELNAAYDRWKLASCVFDGIIQQQISSIIHVVKIKETHPYEYIY